MPIVVYFDSQGDWLAACYAGLTVLLVYMQYEHISILEKSQKSVFMLQMPNVTSVQSHLYCGISYVHCHCSIVSVEHCLTDEQLKIGRILPLALFVLQVVQIIKYKIYSNNIKSEKIISYKDNLGGITHHSHALSTVILSITRYGCLIVFDYINNIVKQLCIKRLHQMSIRVCKINLNSLFVFTGSDDCMIKITNILNGICLYTLHNHQAPINTLAIDPYQPTTLISGCYNETLC
ncbi:unnamed protein product [Rotaria sp. Silwood1]|nr:unnamed protein product [Rotaria sp. Silwood1]